MIFRDVRIRRKLAWLVLAATVMALVLACLGFAIYERARFRSSIQTELKTLADTLGANTAASIAFNDQITAHQMLGALRTEPHIVAACLYDERGEIFAEYHRPGLPITFRLPQSSAERPQEGPHSLVLRQDLFLNGERTGSIAIVSDLAGFRDILLGYARIAFVVLITSLLTTFAVANPLLRIVTDPILKLSAIAQRVSLGNDYSLRARSSGNDEVGKLVNAFNQMLETIQLRDRALQKANDGLEMRVEKRTAELQNEVQERKQAEGDMRKAKDAAEIANRAKSEFLANMSHEIRTPLNGVIGMTDLALGALPDEQQREYLETIKLSGESLLTVINDILDFSKIEAGKMNMEKVDFDLRDCLEEALKPLAARADERGIELLCEIASGTGERVEGDPTRLRQVILNLVGNAIKFTTVGEVVLRVRIEEAQGDIRLLHFTVADTGIGVAREKCATIFDPFTQADTSTTRKYGGTGLGLTICARLVAMMGGRIWVESELGRGSEFHFTVPLRLLADHPKPRVRLSNKMSNTRILIVDDNVTNQAILAEMIRRQKLRTMCVASGDDALAELLAAKKAGDPYRLILADAQMPGMDGFKVIERIRLTPELSTPAILMLTAVRHSEDVQRCVALGVAAYLDKPIRKWELLAAIAKTLGDGRPSTQPLKWASSKQNLSVCLRILLAEDNRINQIVAVRTLEKMGHSVVVVPNGREALSALARHSFDLVLMDIQMPEMDGLTATRKIRQGEVEGQSNIPIVAMTAHAMKGDRERCLEGGMDGYVSKPIARAELEDAMASALKPTVLSIPI